MRKFRQAQAENQIAIQRHLRMNATLDSSSDDDEEDDKDELQETMGKVMSLYQGENSDIEKVLSYLINTFQSGGAVCLICISIIKKVDPIWNCSKCFSFMHLSCISHWIRDSLSYKREKGTTPLWACPKCRMEYAEEEIPRNYECFCKKTLDPPYQPWCIPHSCGETCGKILQPSCGHKCTLLCHPGPCPPCAKMVSVKCFCAKMPACPRRCNSKYWSCGNVCGKKYEYCVHTCKDICHSGDCPPCSETALTECHCKSNKELRRCNETIWSCSKPCGRPLQCNVHSCQGTCHLPGDCGVCLIAQNRTCPCGKKKYNISCKQQQTPTCKDTCGKLLDCGSHFCNMRCHSDRCGQCLEVVAKTCRCGSYKKEIACIKEFHCNKKCTQLRQCGRHLCNRKCCDCLLQNTTKVCEKVCDNTLSCKKHKCSMPCHSGPCYPCTRTDVIQCRCGSSKITVPCGTMKRIKPPPCNKLCKIPPICHHTKSESHKCHQGPCPPCKKVCSLTHKECGHTCPATCHTKVWMKIKLNGIITQPAGPWEKQRYTMQLQTLPCPPCEVSVQVTCLGGHETRPWPCHNSKPTSCQRPCGKLLSCTNHTCELLCHKVKAADNDDGIVCMTCEMPCLFPRPKDCTHKCPKPCHPAPCSPCKQLVKISCHCGISTLYRYCSDLTYATKEKRKELLRCGNQCPKNYPCGHRCVDTCHPGDCEKANECNKKVKLWCKCKRIKKDYPCITIRKEQIVIECDLKCRELKEEKERANELALAQKRQAEEMRNKEEIERFERKFKPKRKGKEKIENKSGEGNLGNNYLRLWLLALLVIIVGIITVYMSVPLQKF